MTETNMNTQSAETHPVVMVVEDVPDDLRLRVDHLNDLQCIALGFTHSDDALRSLFAVPGVDLILTDIDLNGTGQDKSGIALARFVHEQKLNIPVMGYSAYISDELLTNDERQYFTGTLLRKGMQYKEINAMFEEVRDRAIAHRRSRTDVVETMLRSLREKYTIEIRDMELVRELVLNTDGAKGLDETLCAACYSLSILHPTTSPMLSRPILIWLRRTGGLFEAEVYGYPNLYSSGTSEAEAISILVELMQLVTQDLLLDSDPLNYEPNAYRMTRFLLDTFDGRES